MDFKGIDWAGNIQMKYEFMYSEVEETIHEDTMKYLEKQVQKVGACVRKFYEEVLEDLIPPSCIRSSRAGMKKPKSTISDMYEEDIRDLTAEDSILSAMPPRVLVGNTLSDASSIKSKAAGVSRRSIGIIRISGDRRIKSNCIDDLNVIRPSVRHDPEEAVIKRMSDASVESLDSSPESPRQNNDTFDIEVIETEDVEKMELDLVSQTTKKHKTFKSKICDVLTLKLRSTRKQHPCVSDHEDSAGKEAYENGWELL